MPRRPARFTQAELQRLLRAAVAASGGAPHVIEGRPDGSFRIIPLEASRRTVEPWPVPPPLAPALASGKEPVF